MQAWDAAARAGLFRIQRHLLVGPAGARRSDRHTLPVIGAGWPFTVPGLQRLTLKWAFGFHASLAWSHPAVAGGCLWGVRTARSTRSWERRGFIHWNQRVRWCTHCGHRGTGGARLATSVIRPPRTRRCRDRATAVDAARGRSSISADHRIADFFEGRVYVPVFPTKRHRAPTRSILCIRGSVSALDAESGAVNGRRIMLRSTAEAQHEARPASGCGPAGIGSAPTVDAVRRASTSRLEMRTAHRRQPQATRSWRWINGAIRWARQVTSETSMSPTAPQAIPIARTPRPDHDVAAAGARAGGNRDVIVIGQKSGLAFAMDPDKKGRS